MWELDSKEGWALKNWCFWTAVLEKTLESPLDCKEIKPVNPKGNYSWILEELMLKLKLQYFGHLMWSADSLEKTLRLGKIEGRRRGGWQMMNGWWHHRFNGYDFEQAPGVGDGQESLVCCSPWGCKELDTTERLNWTELNWTVIFRASQVVLVLKDPPANAGDARHGFDPRVWKILWRRKWQSVSVFLPGQSHGQRGLVGYSPRGWKELDTTEWLHFHFLLYPLGIISLFSMSVSLFLFRK